MTHKEKLWHQMLPMTRHLALLHARRFPGIQFSDLRAEAETLLQAVILREKPGAVWRRSGGRSFESWCYYYVNMGLMSYCAPWRRRHRRELLFINLPTSRPPERFVHRESGLASLLRSLGEDAAIVVRIICDAPAEIADELKPSAPVRSRRLVREYLRGQGWDEVRLDQAWKEVASCL